MSFGLLGEHLSHSYSPLIHKMIGAYDYQLFEVAPDELADFIENGQFSGLNVTMPYKEAVMPYVELDPIAERLGAVNTIYLKDGKLRGTNTDYFGFMYLLSLAQIDLTDKKILILGTGGASKVVQAISHACNPKKVFVASRQKSKDYVSYNTLPTDVDIVINATPVGTYPNSYDKLIDLSKFTKCQAVIDLIYNPSKTNLLLQAEKMGIKAVDGMGMLVAQATKSAQFFVGMDFLSYNKPILANLKALELNITLIGMPGSGKSAVGLQLSKLTGRKFIDIDQLIEDTTGDKIEDLINLKGESYFRQIESELLKEFAKESQLVIATGGGAVLSQENRDYIRANSMVVELTRDFNLLDTEGRPLSQAASSLEELYEQRKGYYQETRDISVENNKTPLEVANEVLDQLAKQAQIFN